MSTIQDGQIISGLSGNFLCPDCNKSLEFKPNSVGFEAKHCGIEVSATPREFIVSVTRTPFELPIQTLVKELKEKEEVKEVVVTKTKKPKKVKKAKKGKK